MAVEKDNPDIFRLVFWSVISVICTFVTVMVLEGWFRRYDTGRQAEYDALYATNAYRKLVEQQRGELEGPSDGARTDIEQAMKQAAESLGGN